MPVRVRVLLKLLVIQATFELSPGFKLLPSSGEIKICTTTPTFLPFSPNKFSGSLNQLQHPQVAQAAP